MDESTHPPFSLDLKEAIELYDRGLEVRAQLGPFQSDAVWVRVASVTAAGLSRKNVAKRWFVDIAGSGGLVLLPYEESSGPSLGEDELDRLAETLGFHFDLAPVLEVRTKG